MTALVFNVGKTASAPAGGGLMRRAFAQVGAGYAAARADVAATRRELALRRGLRGLDGHLLRDLGIDRSGC